MCVKFWCQQTIPHHTLYHVKHCMDIGFACTDAPILSYPCPARTYTPAAHGVLWGWGVKARIPMTASGSVLQAIRRAVCVCQKLQLLAGRGKEREFKGTPESRGVKAVEG